ncbi:hypothetical protein NDU88_005614 [Pleurodeles waltl]|uniref:Uncharacterized protein n=1 Tax=Pleurodeles waltl TaxID=8319 RepID=A0AAV7RPQ0_PLEWA|nr:hypothetical protein NDU88_005614 [Pleurodeles waltl]
MTKHALFLYYRARHPRRSNQEVRQTKKRCVVMPRPRDSRFTEEDNVVMPRPRDSRFTHVYYKMGTPVGMGGFQKQEAKPRHEEKRTQKENDWWCVPPPLNEDKGDLRSGAEEPEV